jgi:hypothetical protein
VRRERDARRAARVAPGACRWGFQQATQTRSLHANRDLKRVLDISTGISNRGGSPLLRSGAGLPRGMRVVRPDGGKDNRSRICDPGLEFVTSLPTDNCQQPKETLPAVSTLTLPY